MSWGWWGSLIGAGAAIIFAPFTGGASLGAIPKFLLLGGAGAALGAGAGSIASGFISNFGDTPKNQLANLGVNPQKLHEEAMKYREKREEFLGSKNEQDLEEVNKLEKKLTSLDETIKNLQVETSKMEESDPEKTSKLAQLANFEKDRDKTAKRIDELNQRVNERNEKLDELFKKAGDPTNYTAAQYDQNMSNPKWDSYKNWGIMIAVAVIFFVILGFLRKLLSNVLKSTSQ